MGMGTGPTLVPCREEAGPPLALALPLISRLTLLPTGIVNTFKVFYPIFGFTDLD